MNDVRVAARIPGQDDSQIEELVEKGLNLSTAIKHAATALDGVGGGHNIAAGATIPKGKEEEFLEILEREIKTQLS